jgi:hypothetical protein
MFLSLLYTVRLVLVVNFVYTYVIALHKSKNCEKLGDVLSSHIMYSLETSTNLDLLTEILLMFRLSGKRRSITIQARFGISLRRTSWTCKGG